MRFHAVLPVRDEDDIIAQCLENALTWCDAIYIYDTGSVDNTWQIVQEFAGQDSRIIPFKKESIIYRDGIRAFVFSEFRHRAKEGDWFVRLDADEFYHISPPEFVRSKVKSYETCIYNQTYEFRYTTEDLMNWESGCETLADRQQPIDTRRRYYIPLEYSEPRMFRYRNTMQWSPSNSFPYNAGFVARQRIPIKHYPHRDPIQLQKRCKLRSVIADPKLTGNEHSTHWRIAEWQEFVSDTNTLGVRYWQSGTELPVYQFDNHLASPSKRIIQFFTHRLLLPILDRTRPKFPADYQPELIPPEVDRQLKSLSRT